MTKSTSTTAFKEMEEEAYHAFLEWPIWLVLREKELAEYLASDPAPTVRKPAPLTEEKK